MSGKNFRVAPASQRTNVEGKQVSNKVLLATPDNEYELMRPDLTYIDRPHHLTLHEPTQSIEFVYFPNRGMVSQVVVTKDGRTVEVGVRGLRWGRIGGRLEQKFCARNYPNRRRWLSQDRVKLGVLPITHDFIATMMGTDRSTVSLAAALLQKKGIIDYVRGAVKIATVSFISSRMTSD
jgi:Crp-like helix-turn-helix domain